MARRTAKEKARYTEILARLERQYPTATSELDFGTPFELLVATILSAQCTDKQVNKVTAVLFPVANTPEGILALGQDKLEEYVHSCGFYQTKAKHIMETCEKLMTDYGGQVPTDTAALRTLPGVGRKTANVVASNAFGIPAIAVDTHVFRVTNRLALAQAKNVDATEDQLQDNIPKEQWSRAHHWLIYHGRRVCHAHNPECGTCTLADLCPARIK